MKDAVERGERVVHVTGERQLLAAHGPARYRGALEDDNAPPGACQHGGGDQPVGPGSDDDSVGVRDRGRTHNPISMPSASPYQLAYGRTQVRAGRPGYGWFVVDQAGGGTSEATVGTGAGARRRRLRRRPPDPQRDDRQAPGAHRAVSN